MNLLKYERIIVPGLMLGLAIIILLPNNKKDSRSLSSKLTDESVEVSEKKKLDKLNENMGRIDSRVRDRRVETQLNNYKLQNKKEANHFNNKNLDYGVVIEGEDKGSEVYKDLNVDSETLKDLSPGDKILKIYSDKKWDEEYSEDYKQVFIEEFKRKALSQGYKVKVNDDLEVISVKKIRQRNSFVSPQ